MNLSKRVVAGCFISLVAVLGVTGCEQDNTASKSEQYKEAQENSGEHRKNVYIPKNGVEFKNYNEAQKLYDDPNTIQWCTATWSNGSAPLFTVPIRGKLTSSSTSYFPNSEQKKGQDNETWNPELRSVDGMYHGNPPAYRYGFTPGGNYVDFSGMEVMCSTQPMKFQRENTKISFNEDKALGDAQRTAQELLKQGKTKEAQEILERASN